jgi:hypothetical protein
MFLREEDEFLRKKGKMGATECEICKAEWETYHVFVAILNNLKRERRFNNDLGILLVLET